MHRDSERACARLCVSVWVQYMYVWLFWVRLVGVLCWGMYMYNYTCRSVTRMYPSLVDIAQCLSYLTSSA